MTKSWRVFLGAILCEMVDFELTVQTAVGDYHVYRDSWTPTVGKDLSAANEHDRHAVAVYWDVEYILGQLPREFLRVAFFFLEHDGSITGRGTDRIPPFTTVSPTVVNGGMKIPYQLTFSGKWKHIKKLKRFFGTHQFSCIERLY